MPKTPFAAADSPSPAGPYSAAAGSGDFVFLSGQVPLDHEGHIAGYSIVDQARKALENMKALVAAAGLGMNDIVKTTIFLTDMDDFQAVNSIYAEYFDPPYPARSTVQVAALPLGVKLEIEAIAHRA
jgi:2-iminobutanoate/2-iminopropanoate deaminase